MSGENHSFGFKGIPNRICKKTVAQAPKFGKLERRKTLNQPCKSKAPEFFTDDELLAVQLRLTNPQFNPRKFCMELGPA